MKKRMIFICMIAVVLAFLLVGCGHKDAYVISGETADESLADASSVDGTVSDEILTDGTVLDSGSCDEEAQKALADGSKRAVDGVADNVEDHTVAGRMDASGQLDGGLSATIYVDVDGAVLQPGVYSLPDNARVFDAVDAAGGLLPEACSEILNQAEHVSDGQKLYIMTKEEWEVQKELGGSQEWTGTQEGTGKQGQNGTQGTQKQAEQDDELVDLNRATESELCTLPGIGQTRAQAIIAYREASGGFRSIDEIQNVSGIKSGTYEKIKNKIKVQ